MRRIWEGIHATCSKNKKSTRQAASHYTQSILRAILIYTYHIKLKLTPTLTLEKKLMIVSDRSSMGQFSSSKLLATPNHIVYGTFSNLAVIQLNFPSAQFPSYLIFWIILRTVSLFTKF